MCTPSLFLRASAMRKLRSRADACAQSLKIVQLAWFKMLILTVKVTNFIFT
jgi:hypothetical protein